MGVFYFAEVLKILPSYKKPKTTKSKSVDFLITNLGLFIVAFGSVIFKKPNHFASGGINGFAIVLQNFIPTAPVGAIMLGANVLLLLLGYFTVNREFIVKSIYGSIALSLFTWLIELIVPLNNPLTGQKLLELIFGVVLAGVGGTLAFYKGASTGGTDILAMMLKKYFKLKISISLLAVDMIIAFACGLIYNIETMLFSIFGVIIKIFVMDMFLENIQSNKIFTIIAEEEQSN